MTWNRKIMMLGSLGEGRGLGMGLHPELVAGSLLYAHGAVIPYGNAVIPQGDAMVAGWWMYFEKTKTIVVALANAHYNPAVEIWDTGVLNAYKQVYSS
jgi:hypothetical protein